MSVTKWTRDSDIAMGKRILAARNLRGLSLQAVADALKVSKGTAGHWETGTRTIKHHDLARLCSLLQVSADEVLFGIRRWPFTGIDFDLVNDLEPLDLGRLEGGLLQLAGDFGIQIKRDAANG